MSRFKVESLLAAPLFLKAAAGRRPGLLHKRSLGPVEPLRDGPRRERARSRYCRRMSHS